MDYDKAYEATSDPRPRIKSPQELFGAPETAPQQKAEEESLMQSALNTVEWMLAPLQALPAFALAPLAHKGYTGNAIKDVGIAFQVAGKAAAEHLLPNKDAAEGTGHKRRIGREVVDRILDDDVPEWIKDSAGVALELVSDPLVSVGMAPSLFMQQSLRAAKIMRGPDWFKTRKGFWQVGFEEFADVRLFENPAEAALTGMGKMPGKVGFAPAGLKLDDFSKKAGPVPEGHVRLYGDDDLFAQKMTTDYDAVPLTKKIGEGEDVPVGVAVKYLDVPEDVLKGAKELDVTDEMIEGAANVNKTVGDLIGHSKMVRIQEIVNRMDAGDATALAELIKFLDTDVPNLDGYLNKAAKDYGMDGLDQFDKFMAPEVADVLKGFSGPEDYDPKAITKAFMKTEEGMTFTESLSKSFPNKLANVMTPVTDVEAASRAATTRIEALLGPGVRVNPNLTYEQKLAAEAWFPQFTRHMSYLAKSIMSGNDSAGALKAFNFVSAAAESIMLDILGATADAGRIVRSARNGLKLRDINPNAFVTNMIKEAAGDKREIRKIIEMIASKSDDELATMRYITRQIRKEPKAGFWGKIEAIDKAVYNYYMNSLLSNLVTQAANFLSNDLMILMQPVTRFMSGGVSLIRGDLDGAAQAMKEVGGMAHGFAVSMQDMFTWIAKSDERASVMRKYPTDILFQHEVKRMAEGHDISAAALGIKDSALGAVVDYAGKLINLPSQGMLKADNVFKMVGYQMELHRRAHGIVHATGGSAAEQRKMLAELIARPDYDALVKPSAAHASYMTFQNELGDYGGWFARAASLPGVRYFATFIRTPINLVKVGVEYSPISPFTKKLWNQLSVGAGGRQSDIALAKMMTGTGALVAAAYAMDDRVVGGDFAGTPLGDLMAAQGRAPYTIRVGGQSFNYGRIEPLRLMLAPVDQVKRILSHLDYSDPEQVKLGSEAATAMVLTYANLASTDGFLRGAAILLTGLKAIWSRDNISELASGEEIVYGTQERVFDTLGRLIQQPASAFVPAFLNHANQVFGDDTKRVTYGLSAMEEVLNSIQARVPGLSGRLSAKYNAAGKPMAVPYDSYWDVVNPVYSTTVKDDPFIGELARIQVRLPHFRRYIEGVRLSNEQGGEWDRMSTQQFHEIMRGLMQTRDWSDRPDAHKRTLTVNMWNLSKQIGAAMMKEKDNDFARKIAAHKMDMELMKIGEPNRKAIIEQVLNR